MSAKKSPEFKTYRTEFLRKIVMSFEYFYEMIQHPDVNRNLGEDLFKDIRFVLQGYAELGNIGIREGTSEHINVCL